MKKSVRKRRPEILPAKKRAIQLPLWGNPFELLPAKLPDQTIPKPEDQVDESDMEPDYVKKYKKVTRFYHGYPIPEGESDWDPDYILNKKAKSK